MQLGLESSAAAYYTSIFGHAGSPAVFAQHDEATVLASIRRAGAISDAMPLVGAAPPEATSLLRPVRPARATDFLAPKPLLSPADEAQIFSLDPDAEAADEVANQRARLRSARAPASGFFDLLSRNSYEFNPASFRVDEAFEGSFIELSNPPELGGQSDKPDSVFSLAAQRYANNHYLVDNQQLRYSFSA